MIQAAGEVAAGGPASGFKVRNVVRDERIRLSGEDSSRRMKDSVHL
jgi:hypothetical protein